MIAQQIRTWEVLSQDVLDLLHVVRREEFVPPVHRALAFVDTEIPLVVDGEETGESMLQPKFEARDAAGDRRCVARDACSRVGSGSGYMAALLASRAAHVVTVEIHPRLAAFAEGQPRARRHRQRARRTRQRRPRLARRPRRGRAGAVGVAAVPARQPEEAGARRRPHRRDRRALSGDDGRHRPSHRPKTRGRRSTSSRRS